MKIDFEDKSYIEIKKNDNGKVIITIQARDFNNNLKKIINSVEITLDDFKNLTKEIL
jgi:tRNA threonylcarbamoyladenosine modification (KEOPS) complex  Pcc1 subunit